MDEIGGEGPRRWLGSPVDADLPDDDDPDVRAGMQVLATLRELEAIEAAMTDDPA